MQLRTVALPVDTPTPPASAPPPPHELPAMVQFSMVGLPLCV
jgi:hypothetical protein